MLLSEGIFCGMQIDGAMNPYTQVWKTTVPVSDPRFSDTGKTESVHGNDRVSFGLCSVAEIAKSSRFD